MAKKKQKTLVRITASIPAASGKNIEVELPPRIMIFAELEGDAAVRFPEKKPVRLTGANLQELGGLRPRLKGLRVANCFSGKQGEMLDLDLTFSRPTDFWVRQIIDSVPILKAADRLLERLREARNDPRVRARLVAWLARTHGDRSEALKKLAATAPAPTEADETAPPKP
jgi:type VI secretion system ImpB/VipA family protein